MAQLFTFYVTRMTQPTGLPIGATFYFYETGTTNLLNVYSDAALTIPAANPIELAAGSVPPAYYTEDDADFRLKVVFDDGYVVDEDPYVPSEAIADSWLQPYVDAAEAARDGAVAALTEMEDITVGPQGPAGDVAKVATRTELSLIAGPTNGLVRYVTESGAQGMFVFNSSNLSAQVSADPSQTTYVPPNGQSGSAGAWVRSIDSKVAADIAAVAAGAVSSVAGKTGAVTLVKDDVGLGNVDNTSDVNKPVSTAQAAAIALKADKAPNIQSVTSAATVTPTFSNDQVNITSQAAGLSLANPTGTAVDGWGIVIRIKDNGTARAISYGTQYRAIGVTLPTTTTINKTLYLGMIYNAADTKWDVVSVAKEA